MVSTAIANLETDLGLELFDRSGCYPVLGLRRGPHQSGGGGAAGPGASGCRPSPGAGQRHRVAPGRSPSTMTSHSALARCPAGGVAGRHPTGSWELLFPLMEDVTELLKQRAGPARHQLPEGAHPERELVPACLPGERRHALVVSPDHPRPTRRRCTRATGQGPAS